MNNPVLVSPPQFDSHPWYNPRRDGDIISYLQEHDGLTTFPLFKGYAQYRFLWKKGLFVPEWSVIRIMWNVGRCDEHYSVLNERQLKGIVAEYHGGQPGISDARTLLRDAPPWEAQHLDQKVIWAERS